MLKNAEDAARGVKKPGARNTTCEVSPKNGENLCEYLIILFFGNQLGEFES